jgi:hypothetical protein
MLTVTQLIGFGAGGAPPPELSFIGQTEIITDLTTYTFTNHAIGAADPTRRVVVAVSLGNAIASGMLASATIAGIAATIHVQIGPGDVVGFISALVPTGTTATIVLTASLAVDRAAVAVYRAINETVATHHATMTDDTLASATLSGTINIPASGWVVAASQFNGNASTAWVGVTQQYNAVYADLTVNRSGGFSSGLPPETARTVSATANIVPGARPRLAAMSWG